MEVIMSKPDQRRLVWDRRVALMDMRSELSDARKEGWDERSQVIYERLRASDMPDEQAREIAFG